MKLGPINRSRRARMKYEVYMNLKTGLARWIRATFQDLCAWFKYST